jgi:hypothetical protein
MRIIFYLAISSILLMSCNDAKLTATDIKYTDLPKDVKTHIFKDEFYDLNKPVRFKVENHKTFLPWVIETKLIRLEDNKSYEIDFEKEYSISTLIIFEDYLYTTNNYNIYIKDSLKYTFSKYKLN